MKRLVIIADGTFVVEAIRLALRQTAGFQVLGFAPVDRDATAAVRLAAPDVVLVDEDDAGDAALARLADAAAAAPRAKLLLLTLDLSVARQQAAFAAGADALVSKAVHPVALGTLIRETADEHVVHRGGSDAAMAAAGRLGDAAGLTPRELEVLRLAAHGLTNGTIGARLWVTPQTVKFHLSNCYRKLGVANRTEATRYAHEHRLLPEPAARVAS